MTYTESTRRMYAKIAALRLANGSSIRCKVLSANAQFAFGRAFIQTIEADGDRREFRRQCKAVGINPALIFLLAGIIWDILWYWWTNRDDN